MSMLFVDGNKKSSTDINFLNHLGIGVFETFVARKRLSETGQKFASILAFDKHYSRLSEGTKALQLFCPAYETISQTLSLGVHDFDWNQEDAAKIRIIVLENHWALSLEPFKDISDSTQGIKLQSVAAEKIYAGSEVVFCISFISSYKKSSCQRSR